MRFLSAERCFDQVQAEPGQLARRARLGIGQPDRRHELELRQPRQDLGVDLVGLAGERREALHALRIGDQDLPAELGQRVTDEAGARHRLDHARDRLFVNGELGDQVREAVGIRRCCRPCDEFAVIA
jgi:hypothetical protein